MPQFIKNERVQAYPQVSFCNDRDKNDERLVHFIELLYPSGISEVMLAVFHKSYHKYKKIFVTKEQMKFLRAHSRFHDADFLIGVELNPGPGMDELWWRLHLANHTITCPCVHCSQPILALLDKVQAMRHTDTAVWMANYGIYLDRVRAKMVMLTETREGVSHSRCHVNGCPRPKSHLSQPYSPPPSPTPIDIDQ